MERCGIVLLGLVCACVKLNPSFHEDETTGTAGLESGTSTTTTTGLDATGEISASTGTTGDAFVGATYYIGPAGDDATTCEAAMDPATPRATFWGGIRCLSAGDRLLALEGLYEGPSISTVTRPIPGGIDWERATTIAAAPGAAVTFRPTAEDCGCAFNLAAGNDAYIVFANLDLDGFNIPSGATGIRLAGETHHIRFDDVEVRRWGSAGLMALSATHHIEFLGGSVHDNGAVDDAPGITFAGDDSIFEDIAIHDNASTGLSLFTSEGPPEFDGTVDRNTVQRCSIFRNGILGSDAGVLVDGNDNLFVNNLVYDNSGVGFGVGYSPTSGATGSTTTRSIATRAHQCTSGSTIPHTTIRTSATTSCTSIRHRS